MSIPAGSNDLTFSDLIPYTVEDGFEELSRNVSADVVREIIAGMLYRNAVYDLPHAEDEHEIIMCKARSQVLLDFMSQIVGALNFKPESKER